MKAEIRFPKAGAISITTKVVDGRLIGQLKVDVQLTPLEVARLLNFQRQHTALDLVIDAPQLEMDLALKEMYDPKAVKKTPPPGANVDFDKVLIDMVEGDKMPFHVVIAGNLGTGITARGAAVAALKTCGIYNQDPLDDPEKLAGFLLDAYPGEKGRKGVELLADILRNNTFDIAAPKELDSANPPPAPKKRRHIKADKADEE